MEGWEARICMADYRIGIIGAGHFGSAHVRALSPLGERVSITMAARSRLGAPWPEAEAAGAQMVPVDALLSSRSVDVVLVCAPNGAHAAYSIAALRAGKHVFCEKPMALRMEDADSMRRVASERGRVLMIGHLTRHAPLYRTAHDALVSRGLGRVRSLHSERLQPGVTDRLWRMDPAMGGGVVFDLMVHDIDLMQWLMRAPCAVTAEGRRHANGAFDAVRARYALADGREAVVEGSFKLAPEEARVARLRVTCDQGEMMVDAMNTAEPIRIAHRDGRVETVPVVMEDSLVRGLVSEWEEFLGRLDGRGEAGRLLLNDARQTVAAASATVASAEGNGVTIRIDADEGGEYRA